VFHLTEKKNKTKQMKKIILCTAALCLLWSCHSDSVSEAYDGMLESKVEYATEAFDDAVVGNASSPTAEVTTKIIKTANLRFETQDLEKSYRNIFENVKKYEGFFENDESGKSYNQWYRSMIIRIPATHFDAFITSFEGDVSYFDRKEITSTDVTAQYIDIDARLKSKKALENRYLELLQKATKMEEMLQIERELNQIREDIEAKQGQMNYLKNQISMATVSIYTYKKIPQGEAKTQSYGAKIVHGFQSGWNNILSFFIGLLNIWPFILILVVLFYILRKKIARKKQ